MEPWVRKDETGSMTSLLSDGDIVLLFIAAIGHDVGHPGNSNAFLVSPYSVRYLSVTHC